MAFQSFVAMKILSFQPVVFTQSNSSSSLTQSTFNPFERIFFISVISNFLTTHFLVTKNKYLLNSLEISIIIAISSSFCNHTKFIIGCHLAVLFVSGIS
ncbi:MAG: hypothetical protein LBC61_01885 [Candidatus Peribacteria bacterium]|nr:hypothetical protein [Candidatus Peribacteria bacterium]